MLQIIKQATVVVVTSVSDVYLRSIPKGGEWLRGANQGCNEENLFRQIDLNIAKLQHRW